MAEPSTFIKLDRNILDWRWYQDGNTARVFIHLILKANIKDKSFRTITVHRGELATSYQSLALELDLSIQNVRTAINHLKKTGEVTVKQYAKFSVISIKNYDLYQSPNSQVTGNQQTDNKQTASDDEFLKKQENLTGKSHEEYGEVSEQNQGIHQPSNSQVTGNQQADNRQLTTTKESKNVRMKEPTSYMPTSPPTLSADDVAETKRSFSVPLLASEQFPELQEKLKAMADFENLEGDFKRFTAATIERLAEIIGTGRVSKGKTIFPSKLIKRLETINEQEKSLIPFMNQLRIKCAKALSKLEDGTSHENYLRTVIVDFLLNYVPASQAEQTSAEENDLFSPEVYTEILRAYNSICKSLPEAKMMSDKRRKAVAAKLQEGYTVDQIKEAFELAETSPFLRGEVSKFRATFDWFFMEDNLLKTLESKYADWNARNQQTAEESEVKQQRVRNTENLPSDFEGFEDWDGEW